MYTEGYPRLIPFWILLSSRIKPSDFKTGYSCQKPQQGVSASTNGRDDRRFYDMIKKKGVYPFIAICKILYSCCFCFSNTKGRVTVPPEYHISLPNYGPIMLCRHFPSMDLIPYFPGECYQFSSLFTVRDRVLQLYDTQGSIRITL